MGAVVVSEDLHREHRAVGIDHRADPGAAPATFEIHAVSGGPGLRRDQRCRGAGAAGVRRPRGRSAGHRHPDRVGRWRTGSDQHDARRHGHGRFWDFHDANSVTSGCFPRSGATSILPKSGITIRALPVAAGGSTELRKRLRNSPSLPDLHSGPASRNSAGRCGNAWCPWFGRAAGTDGFPGVACIMVVRARGCGQQSGHGPLAASIPR